MLNGGSMGSLLACGAKCLRTEVCGGFVYDLKATSMCSLVVDYDVVGAVKSTPSDVYRMVDYKNKYKVFEFVLDYTATMSRKFCESRSMGLLSYPVTSRERATLSIRAGQYFFIDLLHRADRTFNVWSTGEYVKDSSFVQWSANNPNELKDSCVGLGYETLQYFDFLCGSDDPDPNTVFCSLEIW
ncbi:C-type lectin fold [Trinorchestia longiramus]|nr:C-type lectin fold [Trinorchestia longiramus]